MNASFAAAKLLASNPGAEYDQTHEVLAELLTTDVKPSEAASRISAIYSPLLREGKVERADSLWNSVVLLAVNLGGDLEVSMRLSHFLNALADQPDVISVTDKSNSSSFSRGGTYWSDLPGFAVTFRDFAGVEREEFKSSNGKKALLNATTFGATYLAMGYRPNIAGIAQVAQTSLKEALEYDHKELANLYILPAATWILLGGARIRDLCQEGACPKDDKAPSVPHTAIGPCLWSKGAGFIMERWDFWKERFGTVAEQHAQSDADIRDYAYRARAAMKRLDM